jgi:fructose-1-phosphate kinase PfkB-like protein
VNERGIAPTDAEWDALRDAVAEALASPAPERAQRDEPAPERAQRDEGRPVLVISGSVPPGTPEDLLPSLIALGRAAGATVIADTSGPALLRAADAGADVLKPNAAELAEATGILDPIDGARELLRRGASLILLSRGAEGMLAVSDSDTLSARLPEALAGNPTGAGDAAVSAAAVLLASGVRDPEAILRRATAWSAAAVLMPLAGDIHPSWPELEAAVIIERTDTA